MEIILMTFRKLTHLQIKTSSFISLIPVIKKPTGSFFPVSGLLLQGQTWQHKPFSPSVSKLSK